MLRVSTLAASALAVSAFALVTPSAFAQDAATSDVGMAQYQFSGMLNTDNVYVRSGPSENDYVVTRLSKGDPVVVVDQKFDWLKILPPNGTFCLVGKAWVDKRGDGSVGRVRDDSVNVNVRIASSINNMITKVALQLKGGDDVTILGEQDEYFKIVPPAGTYMYVHKKFVDPVKRVEVINNNGKLEVKTIETASTGTGTHTNVATGNTTTGTATTTGATTGTSTNTVVMDNFNTGATTASNGGPTTKPTSEAVAAAEKEFDALEAKVEAAMKLKLEDQPLDELLAGYQKIVAAKTTSPAQLRIAQFRIERLTLQKDMLAKHKETEQMRAQIAAQLKPIEAENQEIAERVKATEIKHFTAVGTLRPSALVYGGRSLYRLTDPQSGRTVIYINSDDPAVIRHEGMFVGVRGEITDDTTKAIKFIQPKEVEQIDPSLISRGKIASPLLPASLQPTASSN